MNTSTCFSIGTSHQVCEDYAIVEQSEDMVFAAVLDGCSGSPNTDVGARLWALHARNCIRRFYYHGPEPVYTCAQAVEQAYILARDDVENFGLSPSSCDCSAVFIAVSDSDDSAMMNIVGDGCFIIKDLDGTCFLQVFEACKSYPQYLRYKYCSTSGQSYSKIPGAGILSLHSHQISKDGEYYQISGRLRDTFDASNDESIYPYHVLNIGIIDWIILTTDGLMSSDLAPQQILEVASRVNGKGDFTQRFRNGLFQTAKANQTAFIDDLGLAGIHFNHDDTQPS